MSELVITSVEKENMNTNTSRLQALSTWFHFLNFATVAVICLIFLKIFRGLSLLYKWMFPLEKTFQNPTILVIGPQKDIVKDIIAQLAQKFRSELIDFQDVIKKTAEIPSKESRAKKSVLLYSHASISSQGNIMELCSYVEKAYNYIDILVIAQNEDRVKSNSTQTFLNHLNRELLEQFWTVMAFLPGMLRRNNGHIISIDLGRSSLTNTGIMRTVYEDLIQSNTKVKLTLVERNVFLENFLPSISSDIIARLIVRSMQNPKSMVKIPSIWSCFLILPTLITRLLMRSISKVTNLNLRFCT